MQVTANCNLHSQLSWYMYSKDFSVLDMSSIDQSGISVSTTFIVWRTHIPKHQKHHYRTILLQRENLCIFNTWFFFDTKKFSSVCIRCPWFYPRFIDHQASGKSFTAPGLFKMIENSKWFLCVKKFAPSALKKRQTK